jgi:peptidoglycan/LPS O-acetylase OafA/YrhL
VWVHNGALLPLVALLVVSLALGGGAVGRVLGARPLVVLGEASYALYILHIPLLEWGGAITRRFAPHFLASWVFPFAFLAVAVLASILVFRRFEMPMRELLRVVLAEDRRARQRVAASAQNT